MSLILMRRLTTASARGAMRMSRVVGLLLSLLPVVAGARGVDASANTITLSLGTEPPSLDSSKSEDGVSGFVLAATNEGLVRLDRRRRIVPAVAERWEIDGLKAVFWLRDDARWQDGSVVTAHDFVYAWRRLVNPRTGASGSTFFSYVIENATEIIGGSKSVESLGVRAVNDRQLEVTLSGPYPTYSLFFSAQPTFR